MNICFVSPELIHLLLDNPMRIGGAELQQLIIARCLKKAGLNISFVTKDLGQPDGEIIEGFRIWKTVSEKAGIPGIRFIYPRMHHLWTALSRADADIYYTRSASFIPAVLAMFCRLTPRHKFIFAGASDTDFIKDQLRLPFLRDRLLYTYGLRHAHAIICQSETQKKLLRANFGRKGYVIPNMSDLPEKPISPDPNRSILWVSNIRAVKRPLLFVDLSRRFPGECFKMIGGSDPFEMRLYRKVCDACSNQSNIQFLGFQSYGSTECHFDTCKVLVNTSKVEGFPNSFLQAWRRGIPVVSFVDPDGIIQQKNLGCLVPTVDALERSLRNVLNHPPDPKVIIQYYRNHCTENLVPAYCSLFEDLLR